MKSQKLIISLEKKKKKKSDGLKQQSNYNSPA